MYMYMYKHRSRKSGGGYVPSREPPVPSEWPRAPAWRHTPLLRRLTPQTPPTQHGQSPPTNGMDRYQDKLIDRH